MATTPRELILDAYTPLSHKEGIGETTLPDGWAPTWVGKEHRRRLNAYLLLAAYRSNVAREWLPVDAATKREHREYGDPEVIVQTIRSAVLGGIARLLIDGADGEVPPEPTEEDAAAAGTDLGTLTAQWQELAARITAATARQEWLDEWAGNEAASRKVALTEDNAVGLGDGVYVLAWDPDKNRVRLRTYDPGFYFPAWDEEADDDEEFPNRVHLAWQYEDADGHTRVRRITYERRLLPDGEQRSYPYSDKPSPWAVYLTDASWRLEDFGTRGVDDLSSGAARYRVARDGTVVQDLDLGIDFIPIVHVPNTIPVSEGGFGESSLTRIAQLLDDISANDSDLNASSALTAAPPIGLSGQTAGASTITTYGPGKVFYTGDGKLDMLDTSKSLDALLKYADWLADRLSVNRQLPAALLGRVNPSDVPSGIAIAFSFGPFRQMIEDMRLIRAEKYTLLARMVQRLAVVGGELPDVLPGGLAFGAYLPTDLDALIAMVVALVQARLMSRATAVRLLQEAGVESETIEAELDSIAGTDFAGAKELADATGEETLAMEYLGLTPPTVAPPAPPAPPA